MRFPPLKSCIKRPEQFREDVFDINIKPMPAKVVIFGHNYVKYLKPDQRPDQTLCIRSVYVSGGKLSTEKNTEQYQSVLDLKADITYILLGGGNDIDQQTHPHTLASAIENLAQEIEMETGGKVRIIGLVSRTNPR